MLTESYRDAHRYDGAVVHHDRRERLVPCAVQPRDLAVVRDVWRYKFLSAPQLGELWWSGGAAWPMQRRLRKLFDAGFVERFRPLARRGSYPWTYHLGEEGHRLLRLAGVIPAAMRFRPRAIYDYGHVLHELQLNAWVLAVRRAAGEAFLAWDGEVDVEPPREARPIEPIMIGDDWSVENLRDPRPRLIRPDAVLTLDPGDDSGDRVFFIEYDRTRRVDKNYEKFRRYDAFLTWWWRHTAYVDDGEPPAVVFVCQDPKQREQFLIAADRELTGHHWHPGFPPDRYAFPGRRWMLFAVEHDAHAGVLEAWRLPPFPPNHPERGEGTVRRLLLARPTSQPADEDGQLKLFVSPVAPRDGDRSCRPHGIGQALSIASTAQRSAASAVARAAS